MTGMSSTTLLSEDQLIKCLIGLEELWWHEGMERGLSEDAAYQLASFITRTVIDEVRK